MVCKASYPVQGAWPDFEWDQELKLEYYFKDSVGVRLSQEHLDRMPKSATQTNSSKMWDWFPIPAINGCSEKFRSIIEEFEPGVHQFIPIKLKKKDGAPHEGNYYVFNACQMFPSILIEETNKLRQNSEYEVPDVSKGRISGGEFKGMPTWGTGGAMFVVSKPKIADRHVWKNQLIGTGHLFFSDELYTRMKKEKIGSFSGCRREHESDKLWIAEQQIQRWLDWSNANPGHEYILGE